MINVYLCPTTVDYMLNAARPLSCTTITSSRRICFTGKIEIPQRRILTLDRNISKALQCLWNSRTVSAADMRECLLAHDHLSGFHDGGKRLITGGHPGSGITRCQPSHNVSSRASCRQSPEVTRTEPIDSNVCFIR